MYGLQHGALAHTKQQAINGFRITSVKPFKRENQRSNLYKKVYCSPLVAMQSSVILFTYRSFE